MLDWLKPKSTRMERGLAWSTQMVIATHAPFAATRGPSREDPDSLVGEAVFDSEAVLKSLMELFRDLAPQRPVKAAAVEAVAAVAELRVLRLSWLAYCNKTFDLEPNAADSQSDWCRRWVDGDIVRAWPHFAEGKAALATAVDKLTALQEELADFCGSDIMALQRQTA
ncbi:hypothetical protein ACH4VR_19855 [Streptomyces sp. NPDC020883]|uniref:hypothetical protein n=1 Tax=Streptomyces sp. NPDC020883 TaxID=3365099 RepID=UPI003789BB9D